MASPIESTRTRESQVNVAARDGQQLWTYKGKGVEAKYPSDCCPALRSTAVKDIFGTADTV